MQRYCRDQDSNQPGLSRPQCEALTSIRPRLGRWVILNNALSNILKVKYFENGCSVYFIFLYKYNVRVLCQF